MVSVSSLPAKARIRVGELAASPLDVCRGDEIRHEIRTALRSTRASTPGSRRKRTSRATSKGRKA